MMPRTGYPDIQIDPNLGKSNPNQIKLTLAVSKSNQIGGSI
jgi:hypothetical protein